METGNIIVGFLHFTANAININKIDCDKLRMHILISRAANTTPKVNRRDILEY